MTTRKYHIISLTLLSAACMDGALADATIYRCGPPANQVYSQIPCEELSEELVVQDQPLLTGAEKTKPAMNTSVPEPGAEEAASATAHGNSMQAFIEQLQKQREEQLAELDRSIEELEARIGSEGSTEGSEASVLLASLQDSRDALISEYNSLIGEAQSRLENQ